MRREFPRIKLMTWHKFIIESSHIPIYQLLIEIITFCPRKYRKEKTRIVVMRENLLYCQPANLTSAIGTMRVGTNRDYFRRSHRKRVRLKLQKGGSLSERIKIYLTVATSRSKIREPTIQPPSKSQNYYPLKQINNKLNLRTFLFWVLRR